MSPLETFLRLTAIVVSFLIWHFVLLSHLLEQPWLFLASAALSVIVSFVDTIILWVWTELLAGDL